MKKLLNQLLALSTSAEADSEQKVDMDRAKAAILLAVAEADHQEDDAEYQLVHQLLCERLNLTAEDATRMLHSARRELNESISLYDFVTTIKSELDARQRRELMQDLWRVAFVDGKLHAQEEHLLRRISELLSVPHSVFIQTKLSVSS